MSNVEKAKTIDPISLATKYCQEFVMIHPFLDGNGRMCRIILNGIMFKYAGIMVPFGENGEQRSEYLGICRRAGDQSEGHGELATMVLRRAVAQLRKKKQLLHGKAAKRNDLTCI